MEPSVSTSSTANTQPQPQLLQPPLAIEDVASNLTPMQLSPSPTLIIADSSSPLQMQPTPPSAIETIDSSAIGPLQSQTAPVIATAASSDSNCGPAQPAPPPAIVTVGSTYLPSITPGVTLPGGLDILFREIPEGCRQMLTLTDIAESANFRGYFTVCELLALKIVLTQRYRVFLNGGVPEPEESPPQPTEQDECKQSMGERERSRASKAMKQVNGTTAAAGSKRRSSWSSGGSAGGGRGATSSKLVNKSAPTPVKPEPEVLLSNSFQYPALTSSSAAGILYSSAPNYTVCSQGCCGAGACPYPYSAYYTSANNALEGMGSMGMEQRQPLPPAGFYGGGGSTSHSHPSSSTIHYTPQGTSTCPPPPSQQPGPSHSYAPPYYPYYDNNNNNGVQGLGVGIGGLRQDQTQQQEQDVGVRTIIPASTLPSQPPRPAAPAPISGAREVRHGLPPPPYRSLALVLRLLKIGNYSLRSFSEVNPNRCKVLFNTQHIVYECHLPLIQPIRDTFQPLRKFLTIDVKFEQITHMQFGTDKLFLRVEGSPMLTVSYNPVKPEDKAVPPLTPQDQYLLDQIENGQLRLSPIHQLYFLNERLVQNLKTHFRDMPQFSRFFQYERPFMFPQIPGSAPATAPVGSCTTYPQQQQQPVPQQEHQQLYQQEPQQLPKQEQQPYLQELPKQE